MREAGGTAVDDVGRRRSAVILAAPPHRPSSPRVALPPGPASTADGGDLHVCQDSADGPLPVTNFMDFTNDTCRCGHASQGCFWLPLLLRDSRRQHKAPTRHGRARAAWDAVKWQLHQRAREDTHS